MREIHVDEIRDRVAQMCIDASNSPLEENIGNSTNIKKHTAQEQPLSGLRDIGIAVFFVDLGQDLRVKNGFITEAINEGVRKAYREGYLFSSIVDPLTRKNTGIKSRL